MRSSARATWPWASGPRPPARVSTERRASATTRRARSASAAVRPVSRWPWPAQLVAGCAGQAVRGPAVSRPTAAASTSSARRPTMAAGPAHPVLPPPPHGQRQLVAAVGRGHEGPVGHDVGHRLVAGVPDAGPHRDRRWWRWPGPPARCRRPPGRPWTPRRAPRPPHRSPGRPGCLRARTMAWGAPWPWTAAGTTEMAKAKPDALELAHEVAVTLGARAGHQAHAQRDGRHGQVAVGLEQALGRQGRRGGPPAGRPAGPGGR